MESETTTHGCDCARNPGMPDCPEWRRLRMESPTAAREHWQAAYGAELQRSREAMQAGDWVTQLQRMGVPAEAIVALRAPRETPALEAARRFLVSPRSMFPLLALLGKPGLGKTVASAFVLADFARKWDWANTPTGDTAPPAMFLPAARFSRLSSFDDADQQTFRHARLARVVVVDDLGDEATDFAKGHVVDLLKERIDRNRATVLTGNVAGPAFRHRYGDALADRIQNRSIRPALDGASLRRREVRP